MKYFDWTATSLISNQALDSYINFSKKFYANPSSLHYLGKEAKIELEKIREEFSILLKCSTDNVFFTSGGTESNNIIIQHLFSYPSESEIITTSVEHSSILEFSKSLSNHNIHLKKIDCEKGMINLEKLKLLLSDKTKMVCLMKVNNVTGNILNIEEAITLIRAYEKDKNRKIHIHSDAVQALGKISFYPSAIDLDSSSFSAHKFYGPKGVGILYNRNKNIIALNKAGGQESGLRGGTENVPGIYASFTALNDALNNLDENYEYVYSLNSFFRAFLLNNNLPVLSLDLPKSSPYIINFSIPNIPSEVTLRLLSDAGFCVSSGSACNSNSRGKVEQTLKGFGIPDNLIKGSIRVSFGILNKLNDVKDLCDSIYKIVK